MKKTPPLWQLLVVQLDSSQFDFTVDEIAALCGHGGGAVRRWSRQLYPFKRGYSRHSHRFDFEEAVGLIKALARNGRNMPDAAALHARLVESGQLVGPIENHPSIVAISQTSKYTYAAYGRGAGRAYALELQGGNLAL